MRAPSRRLGSVGVSGSIVSDISGDSAKQPRGYAASVRWVIGAIVILSLIAFGTFSVLVPPKSGPGWALDDTSAIHRPLMSDRGVVLYTAANGHPLLVATVFDSSHCPPAVRSVSVGDARIDIVIARGLFPLACTADAAPHEFRIRLDQESLPLPITVVVHHDSEAWTSVIGPGG
jgi:hypothetical protein